MGRAPRQSVYGGPPRPAPFSSTKPPMTVILRLPADLAAVVVERSHAMGVGQDEYVLHVVMAAFKRNQLP